MVEYFKKIFKNINLEFMKKTILALLAFINTTTLFSGSDDLYWATYRNDEDEVRALLDQKHDPNGDDINHWVLSIPLHMAILQNNKKIAENLLKAGANILQKNSHNGQDALHVATIENNSAMVLLLLQHNANPNSLDDHGKSPLYVALLKSYPSKDQLNSTKIEVVQHLLEYGAFTSLMINDKNKKMYDIAEEHDRPDIVDLINQHEIKRLLNLKKSGLSQLHNMHFLFVNT